MPDTETITLEVDKAILASKILRALVVEDDDDYRQGLGQTVRRHGFSVDEASSLEEAERHLDSGAYTLVLLDNVLTDGVARAEKGSEFIRRNWDIFRGAKVKLVTGFALGQVENAEFLEEKDVEVLKKEDEELARKIGESCQLVAEEALQQVKAELERTLEASALRPHQTSVVGGTLIGAQVYARARQYLVDYIKRMPDQNLKQVALDGVGYSPGELLAEVEIETSVGRELVDMLLDDLFDED